MTDIEETVRRAVREGMRVAIEQWQAEQAAGALSLEEAARYLGVRDEKTVQGLVRRREIAFVKAGRETVVPRAALDRYLVDHLMPVEERPWGLTEQSLRHVREGRAAGRGRQF